MTLIPSFVTRFAPSPTGHLHLGHAKAALFAAQQAQGGRFLLRIEDIDLGRCRPEYESAIIEDDEWIDNVVTQNGKKKPLQVADLEPEQDDTGSSNNKPRVLRRCRQIQAAKNNKTQFADQFADIVKARLMPKSGTGILRFMDFETTLACA